LGLAKQAKRINWLLVRESYNQGLTYRDCRLKFKFSASAWDKAVKRGLIIPRTSRKEIHELKSGWNIKNRLLSEGKLNNICSECGQQPWWNGKPLVLQLDHKDGDKKNNQLDNLRILCPHCHTQTPTWGRKIRK